MKSRWQSAQKAEGRFWKNHQSVENPYYAIYLDILKSLKIKFNNKKVLDIGSGIYGITDRIKGKERYSVEPLLKRFSRINLPKDVKRIKGIGENLPFEDDFFDMIFCLNTLDHTSDPAQVSREIRRCLKNKGIFFLSLNCYDMPIVKLKRFAEKIGAEDICHPHSFNALEIDNLLTSYGFENIYYNVINFPIKKSKEKKEFLDDFSSKASEIIVENGWKYIFKRILIWPLQFIFNILFKSHPNTIFIYKIKK